MSDGVPPVLPNVPPAAAPPMAVRREKPISMVERNVVLVGPSGGGKSEIINALVDYGDTESVRARLDPKSVTQDSIYAIPPLQYRLPSGTFTLRLYDTRGLTDSSARFEFNNSSLSFTHCFIHLQFYRNGSEMESNG